MSLKIPFLYHQNVPIYHVLHFMECTDFQWLKIITTYGENICGFHEIFRAATPYKMIFFLDKIWTDQSTPSTIWIFSCSDSLSTTERLRGNLHQTIWRQQGKFGNFPVLWCFNGKIVILLLHNLCFLYIFYVFKQKAKLKNKWFL